MKVGLAQCVNKGMQRDYSMDKASQEFAYENKNIRITTTGNKSFLSVTNEKSTKNIGIYKHLLEYEITVGDDGIETIKYTPLTTLEGVNDKIDIYTHYKQGGKSKNWINIHNLEWSPGVNYMNISHIECITEHCYIYPKGSYDIPAHINGTILGTTNIGDYIIVFAKTETEDTILRLQSKDDHMVPFTLYSGDLGFDLNNPIECITSYEADDILKVYWVDGKNQPRYINVAVETKYPEQETFNFVPLVNNNLDVTITKEFEGSGVFTAGVVQYYITGYKKFGAESNALYVSPLYYISPKDRGGEPGSKQNCNFKISLTSKDNTFDYLRVYSVVRTSLEGTPQVSIVQDVNITKANQAIIVVDNNKGVPVAPTDVLFLGGNTITAGTIEQKDNTLFLGDIKVAQSHLSELNVQELLDDGAYTLDFGIKCVKSTSNTINKYYSYSPSLEGSSQDITTFKYLEWYRFGIQFQLNTSEWSQTYFLKDLQNTIPPNPSNIKDYIIYNSTDSLDSDNVKYLTMVYCKLNPEFVELLKQNNIIGWRLMVAEHDASTRTIKAQGLVLPTLFNIKERINEFCVASPIWTLGQCHRGKHFANIDTTYTSTIPSEEVAYNKQSPMTLLPNTMYFNKDASISSPKFDTTLLSNVYSTIVKEKKYNAINSIELRVTIDRVYTWDDDYTVWGLYAGDVFYAKLKIGIFDGSQTQYYYISSSNSSSLSQCSNKQLSIASVQKLYGQRKSGCKELSSKLSGLLWSDLKDYYIIEYPETIQVKDLDNFVGSDPVFKSGEVPSGGTMRGWVTPSSEVFDNLVGIFGRDFSFDEDESLIDNYNTNYFIDANICNFLSPDVENVQEDMSFRIVGGTEVENVISDYTVSVEDSVLDGVSYSSAKWTFSNYKAYNYLSGITSYPLWPYNNRLYYLNYWNQSGAIVEEDKFKLKSKKFANMWYLKDNTVYEDKLLLDYSKAYQVENSEGTTLIDSKIYKGRYENLLSPKPGILAVKISDEGSAINDTFTLSAVDSALNKIVSLESVNRGTETLSIKSKSSEHVVFKLPSTRNGKYEVLPNYGYANAGNCDIFGNTNTQILNVDRIIYTNKINVGNDYDYSVIKNKESISKVRVTTGVNAYHPNISVQYYNEELGEYKVLCTIDYSNMQSGTLTKGGSTYNINSMPSYWHELSGDLLILVDLRDHPFILYCSGIEYRDNSTSDTKPKNVSSCIIMDYSTEYDFLLNSSIFDTPQLSISLKKNTGNEFEVADHILYNTKRVNNSYKLHIGEFYVPYNPVTFMGGNTENAKELNTYIPISGVYHIDLSEVIFGDGKTENGPYSIGYGLEGDTYYQRWDYLRIAPVSDTDVNQPSDSFSMMVETHKNLDSDYRELRGRLDVVNLTTENTNLVLNDVYNQSNNYITSSILDTKYNDSTHPTTYLWSLPKQSMADIDNWTQVKLTSSAKLDGDKGVLTKLMAWNNKLLAFQEKGIALINYNNQTTISSDEGVPVEIGNSGKVTGHYYLSTTQGCKNKWSITNSPYGVYFVDSYNKSINVLGDNIKSLSTINLFEDWILDNEHSTIWNPNNVNRGFKSFYDPIHKEVYFVNGDHCLCYNELLQQFTSFYDYQNMNYLNPINGHIYSFTSDSKLYKMFEGDDYCNLFDTQCNYSMTYKVNKDSFIDKTWTNIEYRADVFNSGNISDKNSDLMDKETFDTLNVWNEYQKGTTNLMGNKYPNARCKFRIWRADFPRDSKFVRDRIRNPWVMLKLEKTSNTNKRMEFHDLIIKYLQ